MWGTAKSARPRSWLGVSMTTSWLPNPGNRHSPSTGSSSPFGSPQCASAETAGNMLTTTLNCQSPAPSSLPSLTAYTSRPVSLSKPGQNAQGPGLWGSPSTVLKSEGRLPLLSEMITHLWNSGSLLNSAMAEEMESQQRKEKCMALIEGISVSPTLVSFNIAGLTLPLKYQGLSRGFQRIGSIKS